MGRGSRHGQGHKLSIQGCQHAPFGLLLWPQRLEGRLVRLSPLALLPHMHVSFGRLQSEDAKSAGPGLA